MKRNIYDKHISFSYIWQGLSYMYTMYVGNKRLVIFLHPLVKTSTLRVLWHLERRAKKKSKARLVANETDHILHTMAFQRVFGSISKMEMGSYHLIWGTQKRGCLFSVVCVPRHHWLCRWLSFTSYAWHPRKKSFHAATVTRVSLVLSGLPESHSQWRILSIRATIHRGACHYVQFFSKDDLTKKPRNQKRTIWGRGHCPGLTTSNILFKTSHYHDVKNAQIHFYISYSEQNRFPKLWYIIDEQWRKFVSIPLL